MATAHVPESTEGPSRTQLVYTVPIYLKTAKQADFNPILTSLRPSSTTGRSALPREPMAMLHMASRSRQTRVPRKTTELLEWLKTDRQGLATLCGFDRIPSRSTLRKVFAELDALKNETRIVKTQITKLLRKERGKPKRETRGKPKAIAEGLKRRVDRDRVRTQKEGEDSQRRVPLKRNRHWKKIEDYRKSRLDCALGIFQFADMFPDDEAAEQFIVDARWPDGVVECPEPNCSSLDVVEIRSQKMRTWRCRGCGRRFNALTCTTLQGIHGSWRSVVLAVYCSIHFPQYTGLSMACALKTDHQTKGHHTVLRLKHHIFQAMEEELPPFSGICQLDDTLIGTVNGVPVSVIGCVEKESGRVRAEVIVGEINKANSTQFIKTATTKDAQLLTDQSGKYPYGLRKRLTVNHSIPEMARWIEKRRLLVTTNTIESFWALLKSFLRIHHAVTLRHLYLYVAAAAWHIGHQREPIVDQMRALLCNSHQVCSRLPKEQPEALLAFQLDLQPLANQAAPKPAPSSKRMPRAA